MSKVTVVQVVYNNKRFIEPVFSAIFAQTYKDFNVVAVISGNQDGGKELLAEKFPQVEIIDLGFNIGFAAGHNVVFEKYDSEFFQLVNPDLILEPDYIEKMVRVFEDEKVGGATGKLLQISNIKFQISNDGPRTIDTTGVVISKSGRARDRGQHEVDSGQYDTLVDVQAVSGAGCMYRRKALEAIKGEGYRVKGEEVAVLHPKPFPLNPPEYFDTDFHSYWEDVDLSWRMVHKGWKNVFVPKAVGYHGRGAGSSKKGYFHLLDFIKHHRQLPARIRELNYQNHIFLYIKNSPHFYPQFFIREFFMLGYILLFEISTLKVVPRMFKLFPKMWEKRKLILAK